MKLIQIEDVTKEILKDLEKNIKSGNRNKIYVTEDGKYELEYVHDDEDNIIGKKRPKKELGYYDWSSWSDKVYRDENGIYTVESISAEFYNICEYGCPPVGIPLIK